MTNKKLLSAIFLIIALPLLAFYSSLELREKYDNLYLFKKKGHVIKIMSQNIPPHGFEKIFKLIITIITRKTILGKSRIVTSTPKDIEGKARIAPSKDKILTTAERTESANALQKLSDI